MGRARAWLRVALMQKKLAEYLQILVDNRDEELVDYFEPDALMMSDEAIIIIGLMVGLNVIDCNLCIKARLIKLAIFNHTVYIFCFIYIYIYSVRRKI